jgi:hypothetical protein
MAQTRPTHPRHQRTHNVNWNPHQTEPGDHLIATDAHGAQHHVRATSTYEGERRGPVRIHDFPVIWVKFSARSEPMPWPVESLDIA